MDIKEQEIFNILKEKDKRIYKIELELFDDAHSGDFRDMLDYEQKTAQEVAQEVLDYLNSDMVMLVKRTTKHNENYDYEKENFKKCPVCNKTIDYRKDGFYSDNILNLWFCREHKLKEIEQKVKLKDNDAREFIKSCENNKQIFYY